MFPTRRRYLVGVSGGRDSVALLDVLHRLGYQKLILCHLNHRLRGNSSAADARFVARLGDSYSYTVEGGVTDVRALAQARRISLEAGARQARMEFFSGVSAKTRCRRIVLAHHADDQVETVIMNLFRGSGGSGARGMKPFSEHFVGRRKLELLRPMLGIWREEIDSYIEEHGLRYREDASNESDAFLRNRIRNHLIPTLKKTFGRDVRKGIHRFATIAEGEEAWMEDLLRGVDVSGDHCDTLSVGKLRKQPVGAQRRILKTWLRSQKVPDVGFDEIESVRDLLAPGAKVAKVNLPGGRHARRRSGVLFIE